MLQRTKQTTKTTKYTYAKLDGKVALRFWAIRTIIKDYLLLWLSKKTNIEKLWVFAGEMYLKIISVLVWCKLIHFHWRMCKNDFCIFVNSQCYWPPLLFTTIHYSVSSKITMKYELSTAFQYWVNERYVIEKQISQQRTISAAGMYSTTCVESAIDHFLLDWT